MGGKSRKSGGVSRELINRIKREGKQGGPKPISNESKPKKKGFLDTPLEVAGVGELTEEDED